MKKVILSLSLIIISYSVIFAQDTLPKFINMSWARGTSLKTTLSNWYFINDEVNKKFLVHVKETYEFELNKYPKISIDTINVSKSILQKTNSNQTLVKPGYIIIKGFDLRKLLNENYRIVTDPSFTDILVDNFNKIELKGEILTRRGLRRQFLRTRYNYMGGRNLYLFVNYSPGLSYRYLTSKGNRYEYYNYVDTAEKTNKVSSFAANFNGGLGWGCGKGHSIATYFSYYKLSYRGANDSINSSNYGLFLAYRFQRIHLYNMLQPLIEVSYGLINGSKNDVFKCATGVTIPIGSKNFYFSLVPYYQCRYSSNQDVVGRPDLSIGARLYSFGIDAGILFKIWRPQKN